MNANLWKPAIYNPNNRLILCEQCIGRVLAPGSIHAMYCTARQWKYQAPVFLRGHYGQPATKASESQSIPVDNEVISFPGASFVLFPVHNSQFSAIRGRQSEAGLWPETVRLTIYDFFNQNVCPTLRSLRSLSCRTAVGSLGCSPPDSPQAF